MSRPETFEVALVSRKRKGVEKIKIGVNVS